MTNTRSRSFAQVFRRAHEALLDDLRKLAEATHLPLDKALHALRPRLEAAARHFKRHVRLEESDGYMTVVLERQPGMEHPVRELEHQHHALRRRLDKLIEEARSGDAAELLPAVRDWVSNVHEHTARETKLVQEAFNLDIGAED